MEQRGQIGETRIMIPESLFRSTLKKAIKTGEDEPIDELARILYGSLDRSGQQENILDRHEVLIRDGERDMREEFRRSDERFDRMIAESDRRFTQQMETMNVHFGALDSRFENMMNRMDTRFESVDRRFENLISQMNTRFEAVDKRFEDLISQMNARFKAVDKRFEDINKRFTLQSWLIGIGFVSINTLIVIITLLK